MSKKHKKTSKKTERRVKKRRAKKPAKTRNPVEQDLLSIKQASDVARVSTTSVYRWIEEGAVEGTMIGGHRFVRQKSLLKHLERRTP